MPLYPIPAGLLTAVMLAATGASAANDPTPERACFASNNWRGWSAPGDGDMLYLRVGLNDIYQVELTRGSHVRKDGGNFLVNRIRGGSNWICSALDLDLTLADQTGIQK